MLDSHFSFQERKDLGLRAGPATGRLHRGWRGGIRRVKRSYLDSRGMVGME